MLTMIDVWRRRHATPTLGFFDEGRKDFRVGLTDIDLNLHLNNAKYLRYMDLTRLEQMLASGAFWALLSRGIKPIIANNEISYIRELRTWQQFTVSARIIGVDDKYLYYDQRFHSAGRLCTHALLRVVCVKDGKSLAMPQVLEKIGVNTPPPALPGPALLWKDMLEAKKLYALGQPAPATENVRHVA